MTLAETGNASKAEAIIEPFLQLQRMEGFFVAVYHIQAVS